MYVYIYIYTHTHTHTYDLCVCVYACMHVCMYVCMYVWYVLYVCMHGCMYVCVQARTYICKHSSYACICMYIRDKIHLHTPHTHTHMYLHTHMYTYGTHIPSVGSVQNYLTTTASPTASSAHVHADAQDSKYCHNQQAHAQSAKDCPRLLDIYTEADPGEASSSLARSRGLCSSSRAFV